MNVEYQDTIEAQSRYCIVFHHHEAFQFGSEPHSMCSNATIVIYLCMKHNCKVQDKIIFFQESTKCSGES